MSAGTCYSFLFFFLIKTKNKGGVRIATNNFTLQEVELLRDIFKTLSGSSRSLQLSYYPKKGIKLLRINILFILKFHLYLD